jgi:hypothetical protein
MLVFRPLQIACRLVGGNGSRCLRLLGKASGYAGAAAAGVEFAGNRRTALFIKASANTGLAVARIHPLINISVTALSFTDYPDRAFESVARRLPGKRS